jgi:hypothetical protein
MFAARETRTVYHRHQTVVIWRGWFCGETALVVRSHGKKMLVKIVAPNERVRRMTNDAPVMVYKTSCCLIADGPFNG